MCLLNILNQSINFNAWSVDPTAETLSDLPPINLSNITDAFFEAFDVNNNNNDYYTDNINSKNNNNNDYYDFSSNNDDNNINNDYIDNVSDVNGDYYDTNQFEAVVPQAAPPQPPPPPEQALPPTFLPENSASSDFENTQNVEPPKEVISEFVAAELNEDALRKVEKIGENFRNYVTYKGYCWNCAKHVL